MGLSKLDNWKVQEEYLQYLDLKEVIQELTTKQRYIKERYSNHMDNSAEKLLKEIEEKYEDKVEKIKFIIGQLKVHGVSPEELILLSLGVDIDRYSDSTDIQQGV